MERPPRKARGVFKYGSRGFIIEFKKIVFARLFGEVFLQSGF